MRRGVVASWLAAAGALGPGCGGTAPSGAEAAMAPTPTSPPSTVAAVDEPTSAATEPPATATTRSAVLPSSSDAAQVQELLREIGPSATAELSFLRRLCTTAVGKYENALIAELDDMPPQLGCACCAPFEDCPPDPDRPTELASPNAIYTLRHKVEGSYTAPGRHEIAATFWGCEPGAGNRGGTAVLRPDDDRYRVVAYRSGVNPDECQNLPRKDGRDLLLCQWGDGQGGTFVTRIMAYDLAKGSDEGYQVIAELVFEHPCLREAGLRYVRTKPEAIRLRDLDGDGQLDVVVDIEHVAGVVTAQQMAECRASTDDFPEPKSLPSPWHTQLHYLYDGVTFTAAPKTKQRLRRIETSTIVHGVE